MLFSRFVYFLKIKAYLIDKNVNNVLIHFVYHFNGLLRFVLAIYSHTIIRKNVTLDSFFIKSERSPIEKMNEPCVQTNFISRNIKKERKDPILLVKIFPRNHEQSRWWMVLRGTTEGAGSTGEWAAILRSGTSRSGQKKNHYYQLSCFFSEHRRKGFCVKEGRRSRKFQQISCAQKR